VVQFGCTGPGQIVVRLADALASQRPGSLSGRLGERSADHDAWARSPLAG